MMNALLLTLALAAAGGPLAAAGAPPGSGGPHAVEAAALHRAVRALSRFEAYGDRAVGYSGAKPPVYAAYERLLEISSDDALLDLFEHGSPVVRAYAFQGLLDRGHPPATLSRALTGPEQILDVRMGCFLQRMSLGELAERLARDHAAGAGR